jgi:CTP:molybdopterin cytidylyltransferase MocA
VTSGLILAAGAGSRFGDTPKQLAELHGRPLLQWAIDAQTAVAEGLLGRIVVVLGSHASQVLAAVDLERAESVVCADWEQGQGASLRCGLRALDGAEKVVVTLGDAPLVTSAVIARFAAESDPARPTRAVYDGRPGHPVVLGPAQIAAILSAPAGDRGARGLLHDARTIETGHLCSGRDVDTPEDLEEVRDEARAVI